MIGENEGMGKGYAEGPAAEEAERRLEELADGPPGVAPLERAAVYGSTEAEPERHFLGWLGEVDPTALFEAGEAYGITVVRQAESAVDGSMRR
jgi:hypothetical protein